MSALLFSIASLLPLALNLFDRKEIFDALVVIALPAVVRWREVTLRHCCACLNAHATGEERLQ